MFLVKVPLFMTSKCSLCVENFQKIEVSRLQEQLHQEAAQLPEAYIY